ncbi:MAG: glycosyltransferase [Chloroflexi bacterium]|nr:glycosyltransferase [Chloroflexota bacterium]
MPRVCLNALGDYGDSVSRENLANLYFRLQRRFENGTGVTAAETLAAREVYHCRGEPEGSRTAAKERSMISVIATVLNEGESMHSLLRSLQRQTLAPDEVVIVDGGSRDDTVAIIRGYEDRLPLRLLIEAGCNISQGRNRAIEAARGDIIAVTDAGVRLSDDWLARITERLRLDPALNAVGGFFAADARTPFELALGATTLPLAREIAAETFLPSSRSIAFRKAAALRVGLYPEWLDYCEDLVFDLRLRGAAGPFAFEPRALAHFRPRATLRQYFRQYYFYARGDGKANLWFKRHLVRYAVYLLLAPLILAAGVLIHPLMWGLYIIGGGVYLFQPYRRLPALLRGIGERSRLIWLYCLVAIPWLRFVGDAAKMLGYPAGLRWRLRQQPPDWRWRDEARGED